MEVKAKEKAKGQILYASMKFTAATQMPVQSMKMKRLKYQISLMSTTLIVLVQQNLL